MGGRWEHLQDRQDENWGWHLQRSPQDGEARAVRREGATTVLGPLQPSEGARCPDLGMEGLRERFAFLGFFLLQEGMQGIYPHPKYRDMGLSCPGSFPMTYFCSPGEGLEVSLALISLAAPPALSHCPSPLPVTLPGVPDIVIIDLMLISLLIQEVKHVFDGEGQGAPTMCCAEDGLKQVVHEFLQGALKRREKSRSATPGASEEMNQVIPLPTSLIS